MMRRFLAKPAYVVIAGSVTAGAIAVSTIFLADINYLTGAKTGERDIVFITDSDCAGTPAAGQPMDAGCAGSSDVVVATAATNGIAAAPDPEIAFVGSAEPAPATETAMSSRRLANEMVSAAGISRPRMEPSTTPVSSLAAWDGPTPVTGPRPLPHRIAAPEAPPWPLPEPPPQPQPATATTGEPESRKATYLVVASYRLAENADRLTKRLYELAPTITAAVIDGKIFFRVVMGPYTGAEIAAVRARLAAEGLTDSWAISLCTADLSAPPCAIPGKSAGAPASSDIAITEPIKPAPAQ